jgi:hypothetical protein
MNIIVRITMRVKAFNKLWSLFEKAPEASWLDDVSHIISQEELENATKKDRKEIISHLVMLSIIG